MVNEALRFALELAALAVYGLLGYALVDSGWRWALAVAVPLGAAVMWGQYAAPRSARRLADPKRFLFEAVFFGGAAATLVWLGWVVAGVAFAVVALANMTLVRVLKGRSFDDLAPGAPAP